MAGVPTPEAAEGRTEAQLAAIYQELILDHYRRPRNKGALEAPDASAERRNPLCGDEIVLQLAFDGDVVREARFTGRGCSISQASASMLTQALRGRTRAEADALLRRFTALVHGDAEAARDGALGELRALQGVARFPARIRCATLAWSALDEALRDA
ncbi:Fe-S cluster assembly sulfur transfer protein SufU [Roseisolibacter agri]|uniref:Iron-sulfur cluster assembly scaffold protein n=1 Tax=Roseisolibacter agri TaxID=2014610 RepID=A0AA37Q518_9BACT|nr:SUF system NifU family Fe-S cluster assembly protein [Roseisolibacter agri]GLC26719.1 iron-sulfur cluster assembly scaffold protein [Roseisolibacter agri]